MINPSNATQTIVTLPQTNKCNNSNNKKKRNKIKDWQQQQRQQ